MNTIDRIRELASQGLSQRAIARDVGVSQSTVARHMKTYDITAVVPAVKVHVYERDELEFAPDPAKRWIGREPLRELPPEVEHSHDGMRNYVVECDVCFGHYSDEYRQSRDPSNPQGLNAKQLRAQSARREMLERIKVKHGEIAYLDYRRETQASFARYIHSIAETV